MNAIETIDPVALGERLRVARQRTGLTQDSAAGRLKMARTTIVAIEQGQRRVKPDELIAMASLYGTPVNELGRSTAVQLDLLPRFRALARASDEPALVAAKLLNDLAAAEVELERILNRPLLRNYPPEREIYAGDIRSQAEEAAIEVRHRTGLGLAPVADVVSLLELEMGIRIFVRPLDSSISGLFAFDDSVGACVLLNAKHTRERRAMTVCHELGHLVSSRTQPDVLYYERGPHSREERFASAFAAAFLMPSTSIRSRFKDIVRNGGKFSLRHLVFLAHWSHVSMEAMCRRLEELVLLPQGTWESQRERGFNGQMARVALGDAETRGPSVVPPRLWLLVSEAHERELLSEGQLAGLLRTDRLEVRRMLDLVPDADDDVNEPVSTR